MATVPDGGTDEQGNLYFVNEAYKILTQQFVSEQDLRTLSTILRRAQNEQATPEQVSAAIRQEAPALAALVNLIKPKNAGEFWTMVAALFMLVDIVRGMVDKPEQPPSTVINQIINQQIINQAQPEAGVATPLPTPLPSNQILPAPTPTQATARPQYSQSSTPPHRKIGPNAPCPCGAVNPATGRIYKYKKCGLIHAPHHQK